MPRTYTGPGYQEWRKRKKQPDIILPGGAALDAQDVVKKTSRYRQAIEGLGRKFKPYSAAEERSELLSRGEWYPKPGQLQRVGKKVKQRIAPQRGGVGLGPEGPSWGRWETLAPGKIPAAIRQAPGLKQPWMQAMLPQAPTPLTPQQVTTIGQTVQILSKTRPEKILEYLGQYPQLRTDPKFAPYFQAGEAGAWPDPMQEYTERLTKLREVTRQFKRMDKLQGDREAQKVLANWEVYVDERDPATNEPMLAPKLKEKVQGILSSPMPPQQKVKEIEEAYTEYDEAQQTYAANRERRAQADQAMQEQAAAAGEEEAAGKKEKEERTRWEADVKKPQIAGLEIERKRAERNLKNAEEAYKQALKENEPGKARKRIAVEQAEKALVQAEDNLIDAHKMKYEPAGEPAPEPKSEPKEAEGVISPGEPTTQPATQPAPEAGNKLDELTAATFLRMAGGDKDRAREIARRMGYQF